MGNFYFSLYRKKAAEEYINLGYRRTYKKYYLVSILNVMKKQSKRKRNGKERRAKNHMIEEVIKSEVKTGKKII